MKTPSHSLVATEDLQSDATSEVHWWNPATDMHRVGPKVFSPAEWRQINAERLYVSVGGLPERLVTKVQIERMKNLISQCQINNDQVNEVWEVVDSFFGETVTS